MATPSVTPAPAPVTSPAPAPTPSPSTSAVPPATPPAAPEPIPAPSGGSFDDVFDAQWDAAVSGEAAPAEEPVAPASPEAPETPAETFIEEPAADEPVEEPAPEEPEPAEEPATETPAEEAKPGDVPEDVKEVTTAKGAKIWQFPKERGQRVYAAYQAAQVAERIMGEPLTETAIQAREMSHQELQLARLDYISGDPEAAKNFIGKWLFHHAASAIDNGETGTDPLAAFSQEFPGMLRSHAPEVYQQMSDSVLKQALATLAEEGVRSGNKDLLSTAQWLSKHKFQNFDTEAAIRARLANVPPPEAQRVQQLEAENAQLRQNRVQDAFQQWSKSATGSVNQGIDDLISERMTGLNLNERFKTQPEKVTQVRDELAKAIKEKLNLQTGDENWRRNYALLVRQAKAATSEQRRAAVAQELAQRALVIARNTIEGRMAAVVEQASRGVKAASDARHQKLASSATRRDPGSGHVPSNTRVAPKDVISQLKTPEDFAAHIEHLF